MRRASEVRERAWALVFAPEDPRRLAALRIGLCALLAVRLAINDYGFVAGQPAALYQPLSYMKLFPAMPSGGVASTAQAIGIATALLAAGGLWIRATLPVAFTCSLLLNGMLNATGKPIHNDVLLTLCLIPLVAAPRASADAWTVGGLLRRASGRAGTAGVVAPGRDEAYGWQVRAAIVIIALTYCCIGLQKWRYSGIEWATGENLRWVLYASSDAHSHANGVALFVADRAWLVHVLAAGTLALETLFPLVLVVPRLRWVFVPGVISMHTGIDLAMGLDYTAWSATVLIAFVDWPRLLAAAGSHARLAGAG